MEGFQSNGLKRWRGFEVMAELGENENPDEAKDKLVSIIQKWHNANTPELELANYQPPPQSPTPEPDRTQAFIDLINSKYQTKKTLESLKPKVEQENNPAIQQAFDNKLKQLQ